MPPSFQPFSNQHFIALGIGAAVLAAFLLAGKRGGDTRRRATALLAFVNFTV